MRRLICVAPLSAPLLQGVLNQARQYIWIPVAQDAYRRISLRVYCHIMDLDLNFHLHKKTGEVTKMVSEERKLDSSRIHTDCHTLVLILCHPMHCLLLRYKS